MIAILLGLSSAAFWGTADFFGGVQSRRLSAFAVVFWSQLASAIILVAVVAVAREPLFVRSLLWGMAGGAVGVSALILFYRALVSGAMSLVAPVSACGASVPVVVSIATGHTPSRPAIAGIVAALAGIVLVSRQPASHVSEHHLPRSALFLALAAACGFGLFYVFVDHGTGGGGSPLWTIVGARAGSLVVLVTFIVFGGQRAPWPGARLPHVTVVGVMDTTANLMWALATLRGSLAVVAVLGALYPVATVLLGQVVLGERLSRSQGGGIVLALCGVALLSAA